MRERPDAAAEGILLAGAGRAILLQLADPAVGYGVARHSDFARNPMARLHGTLMYVYAVMTGTPGDRAAAAAFVDRRHAPVSGPTPGETGVPRYDARDPALQLWVAATLYDTATLVAERVLGPLPAADADRLYRRYAALGTALQVPDDLWPADRAAFRAYWDRAVAGLAVNDVVRAQVDALFRATAAPPWVRALMPVMRFLTAELLPERVAALYGLTPNERHRRRARVLWRAVAALYGVLPSGVRTWPSRYYLARLRRLSRASASASSSAPRD